MEYIKYKELQAEINKYMEAIDECGEAMEKMDAENKRLREGLEKIDILAGDVEQSNWPVPQMKIQQIAQNLLAQPDSKEV